MNVVPFCTDSSPSAGLLGEVSLTELPLAFIEFFEFLQRLVEADDWAEMEVSFGADELDCWVGC